VLLLGRSRRRVTIGRYPTVTLSQARSHARELIAARVLGKDDLPAMKFEDAIPVFLAAHFGENYPKPRTKNEVDRLLRRHFLPKLRDYVVTRDRKSVRFGIPEDNVPVLTIMDLLVDSGGADFVGRIPAEDIDELLLARLRARQRSMCRYVNFYNMKPKVWNALVAAASRGVAPSAAVNDG